MFPPPLSLPLSFPPSLLLLPLLCLLLSLLSASSLSPNPLLPSLQDRLILAPLTRAGNLPFRRLCADLGCEAAVGEMVYARHLLRGQAVERARLRRACNEKVFGVQIATNDAEEGAAAVKLAREAGADFVDLNCGCPINEATRRGLGSALLRSPEKLGLLVAGIVAGAGSTPVTVKLRLGTSEKDVNVLEVARAAREAGASAVAVHGRTAVQRYSSGADWGLIKQVVDDSKNSGLLVVGNGDILTHGDARSRMAETGVDAVMVGRGALEKPWIFQEFEQNKAWDPTGADRVGVYRRLAVFMKDHFMRSDHDPKGREMAMYFLPWHFEFFCRYNPLGSAAGAGAGMQSRWTMADDAAPLDRLLASRHPSVHKRIADMLWSAGSDGEAVRALEELAESAEFEELQSKGWDGAGNEEVDELANIPKSASSEHSRKERVMKPKRTEEEIKAVRAERKMKREALGIFDFEHVSGNRRGSQ